VSTIQGFPWRDYGSEQPGELDGVMVMTADDGRSFWLVHGIVVDPSESAPRIVIVKGRRDVRHVEFSLLTGERAASWDVRFVETFWKLGAEVEIHARMPEYVELRLEARYETQMSARTGVYSVTSMPS